MSEARGEELVAELTDFTFALRLAGLDVTIDRSMGFLRAVAGLDSVDHVQLFWAGRSTLCVEPADFDIFDDTFNWFFRRPLPTQARRAGGHRPGIRLVDTDSGAVLEIGSRARLDAGAPGVLQHRDLAELSDDERAELGALLRLLDPSTPRRSALRPPPIRQQLTRSRTLGTRPRKLVLLLDASDSMAPHAEPLLRFAHAARRRLGNGCEVFTLGSTLTRLSEVLADRDQERALDAVSGVLPGWSGGTRIGQALQSFLDQHGQRGMARGAVVIVFSDGWERGSPDLLVRQTRRLSRLTRSLIWVNPHQDEAGMAPVQGGIVAVRPFLDHLLAGGSLTALGELMDIAHDA